MAVWEIIILMVAATISISFGIGFVYNSIVNTVERYQIRKTERELRIYAKIMEEIPKMFISIIDMIDKKEKEENRKYMETMMKKEGLDV